MRPHQGRIKSFSLGSSRSSATSSCSLREIKEDKEGDEEEIAMEVKELEDG